MTRSIVRTVLGDIDASELGTTYAHEHLVLDSPLIAAAWPHILLDDPALAIREVMACREVGVRTMVDAMPCAAGRDAVRLAAISLSTNVNIISATGLHHERYYGPRHWTTQLDVEALADLFIKDINDGIDAYDYTSPIVQRTGHRAGIVKVATGGGQLNRRDETLFQAAALTHAATGVPILTHCEHGRGALEQVNAFTKLGVPAEAILLSHIDKVTDIAYQRDIAQSGAWLLFDQGLREAADTTPATAVMIGELAADGDLGQILLGTDGARRDLWQEYDGSPGLHWLADEFPIRLSAQGLATEDIDQLFRGNPARALALQDRSV